MIFAENKITLDPVRKINKSYMYDPFDFQEIYSKPDDKKKRYEFYKGRVPKLIDFIKLCINADQVFT